MKNLVTFPSGGVYEDSGEGGLYVMMVVPEPNGFWHNCHVDGIITVSEVDVEVTNSGIWQSSPWESADSKKRRRLDDIVRKADRELYVWSAKLVNMDDASTPLLFAAHMGSTPESLWNAHRSEYFTANVDHLTHEGRALYESVKAAYGIDPVLVTCLDT